MRGQKRRERAREGSQHSRDNSYEVSNTSFNKIKDLSQEDAIEREIEYTLKRFQEVAPVG